MLQKRMFSEVALERALILRAYDDIIKLIKRISQSTKMCKRKHA